MRILLIDPPYRRFTGGSNFYFPTGLAYLAAVLSQSGYDVSIYDVDIVERTYGLEFGREYEQLQQYIDAVNDSDHPVWVEVRRVLEEVKPDIVGITAMTTKIAVALKIAALCKEWENGCYVILGGPHPTLEPEQTLQCESVDFVVKGEGEDVLLNLVKAIEVGSEAIKEVSSICYRSNGHIKHNMASDFIDNLDYIPQPARRLLMNVKDYNSEDMGAIMSSRGCPYHCTYCSEIWGRKIRYRSIDNVMEEIEMVVKDYGVTMFTFRDDTFTVGRSRAIELCEAIINSGLRIGWDCSTRVNLIDKKLLRLMFRAGCKAVKFGVETGSPRIMKEIDKGVTLEQIKETASLLNKSNVFWSAYFIMGLPMETEKDIEMTYQFMKELNPSYAGIGLYKLFPKTVLYQASVDLGLAYKTVDVEHFLKRNPMDYYLINPKKRVVAINEERLDEIANRMRGLFHKHNTRFTRVFRRAYNRRFMYLKDPQMLALDCKRVFSWVVKGR